MSIPASWFIQILNMSIGAAWAALLVMAGRLLLHRAPKAFSYALWTVVLFRLVCPVSFTSVFSLMPRPQTVPQEIVYAARPEIQSGFQFFDQAVNQSLPPATPAASVNPVQLWLEIGNLVWQAGMILMLAYCVISYLRFRTRLREAVLREGNVWESDRIPTAFVLGFLRPRIYLPLGLSEEERRYILCHEETHIRRKDHLVKPLALLLLCVHWFNPVLWAAYFLMCRDMEMSCDERVMELLGPGVRKGYSSSLLAISERQSGLVSPLAFGENDVKSRIQNVLRYQKPALWVLAAAAALGVVLAFCLIANPKGEEWVALSQQEGIPYHDAIWGESILVERRNAGSMELEDPEKVRLLGELVSGLEVSKRPVPAGEQEEDWELRLTFRRPDTAGVGDFTLCFTDGQVWEETARRYQLKSSSHIFRTVEEYTFLTAPDEAGEYRVGFQEVREGQGRRYILVTEPMVGSRLASLLLDGTQLEGMPGKAPPVENYLFINMGNPGTAYYVYESGGRYFVERPEDYRLELSHETYLEIRGIWQTVSRREAPDKENGYYTGFEETVNGERLRKFSSYRGETPSRLAELILGGADVPLNPLEKVVPSDSFLRVEIGDPGSAYYVYEYEGHYYAEQMTNYRVELTGDAYQQIRDIYLDAAMEGLENEALSFYADGELADIARVGIEGYFDAFTAGDIPEELKIYGFTVGEITPMAGTPEEFCVSFIWDYDTTQASRWISANGNGVPAEDFDGWHWIDNYQEFRFRRTGERLYQIIGRGTGGGGQGLEPISTQPNGSDPAQMATAALTQLFSSTVRQAEELDAALQQSFESAISSSGTGMVLGDGSLNEYFTTRFGGSMTGRCIDLLKSTRVFSRSAALAENWNTDIHVKGLALGEQPGRQQVYFYSGTLATPDGRDAATVTGTILMEKDGDVWKASYLTASVKENALPEPAAPTGADTSSGVRAEQFYQSRSIPLFASAFRDLGEAEQGVWLDKLYADGEIAFFSAALQEVNADSPQVTALAEKTYGDGAVSFFSVLANGMSESAQESWLSRAMEDQKTSFQSVLLKALDREEELDELEEELAKKLLEEYAAYGVTKKGKEYYYQGNLVNIFLDRRPDSSFYTLNINPEGTVNVKIMRDTGGDIESVAYMTEAEADELLGG